MILPLQCYDRLVEMWASSGDNCLVPESEWCSPGTRPHVSEWNSCVTGLKKCLWPLTSLLLWPDSRLWEPVLLDAGTVSVDKHQQGPLGGSHVHLWIGFLFFTAESQNVFGMWAYDGSWFQTNLTSTNCFLFMLHLIFMVFYICVVLIVYI